MRSRNRDHRLRIFGGPQLPPSAEVVEKLGNALCWSGVAFEIGEAVPGVVDAIDARIVGPEQIAAKLEIIGRIGEDEIDGGRRHLAQRLDAIALKDFARTIGGEARFKRLDATHDSP